MAVARKSPLLLLALCALLFVGVGGGVAWPWLDNWFSDSDHNRLSRQSVDVAALQAELEREAQAEDIERTEKARIEAAERKRAADARVSAEAEAARRAAERDAAAAESEAGAKAAAGTAEGDQPEAETDTVATEEMPVAVETVEGQQVNPNIAGALGEVSARRINGWVICKAEREAAMFIEVEINDARSYEVRADKREEHKTLGVIWRFSIEKPEELQDTEPHVVRAFVVRRDQHGRTELSGSPRTRSIGSYPRGKLEEATPEKGISGYAWDPDDSKKPVKLIVRIDGDQVAELQANAKNEELLKRKIAPVDTCAFKLAWPASLDDGLEHTVQIFAVDLQHGTEHEIDGSPRVVSNRGGIANQPPVGRFEIANKVVLAGWSYDPDAGQGSNDVEIWIDNELFITIAANCRHDNLRNSKQTPDPYHGFVTTTPGSLLDGKSHTIRVYGLNSPHGPKVELGGSPRTYRMEENSDPMGGFWHADEKMLRGWAADPELGTVACDIEVYIDGKLWQKLKADRREEWLIGTGYAPNPEHGFAIVPPEWVKDGENHEVKIYAINHPEGPPRLLGTRTIGVSSTFPGFWAGDKLIDTRIDRGLYVSNVSPWFDAFHKGVKAGDVLLEYEGIEAGHAEEKDATGNVTKAGTMTQDFKVWLNTNKKAGDIVRFKFWRDGETYEADVKMGQLNGQ